MTENIKPQFSFSDALNALKEGHKVQRAGWNALGMFVYRVPAATYPAQTEIEVNYFGADNGVPYNAYYALKTAQETIATWVPSSTDLDANDWQYAD
jgi:hypothetical protein